MKKWIVAGIVLMLAGISIAFAAYRKSGFDMQRGFHKWQGTFMGQRILALLDNDQFRAKINLTDDQANHLRKIVVDAEKSAIETRAQMAVDGIDLRELLRADKPDQDAVMKKAEEIMRLRGQIMKNSIQGILEAKSVLTPEQQKKIQELLESRFSRGVWGARWMGHGREGMMRPQNMTPSPGQSQP